MECKRYISAQYVKSGIVRGHRRCGCNFTDTPRRGKPESMNALTIQLYTLGNARLGMIGTPQVVSNVVVLKWERKETKSLDQPCIPADLNTSGRQINEIGLLSPIFMTNDWEGFHLFTPLSQLFTGKDLTHPTAQDNGNTHHYLAHLGRKAKVKPRRLEVVDLSLLLLYHLLKPETLQEYLSKPLLIFRE